MGQFLQKSPMISGSFAKRDLQLETSYASLPLCTEKEGCFTFTGHFPQKSPMIRGSLRKETCNLRYPMYLRHYIQRKRNVFTHDSFTRDSWLIRWLIYMCDVAHSYIKKETTETIYREIGKWIPMWLIHMWLMTHSLTQLHVWRDFSHTMKLYTEKKENVHRWLIHTWLMAHSHVTHGSFTRDSWLIRWLMNTCDMTCSHVWRHSFLHQKKRPLRLYTERERKVFTHDLFYVTRSHVWRRSYLHLKKKTPMTLYTEK